MRSTVETQSGKITGSLQEGVFCFKGIPFAEPPIGALRFKKPVAVRPWAKTLEARQFGKAAIQEVNPMNPVSAISEDCLNLNIWSPDRGETPLPVMVWLHGGSFTSGAGSMAQYDGHGLAKRGGVIVVNINYRLGVLGFAHFNEATEGRAETNLGLRDQLLALRWLNDNIEAFGGDRNNITLFGESAGAMSVACLLASPLASGLFHKAIVQSGSADHVLKQQEANKTAQTVLQALGINSGETDRLWEVDSKALLKAQRACGKLLVNRGDHARPMPLYGMTLIPVFGDDVLPEAPIELLKKGAGAQVPLIIGTTTREWELFLRLSAGASLYEGKYKNVDEAGIVKVFERSLPGSGRAAFEYYKSFKHPGGSPTELLGLYSDFETDRTFSVPSLRIIEARQAYTEANYHFLFAWDKGLFGACHGMDIPFVFGTVNSGYGKIFSGGGEVAAALSEKVQDAWLAFSKTGSPAQVETPSSAVLKDWTAYTQSRPTSMVFDGETRVECDTLKQQKAFWEGVL